MRGEAKVSLPQVYCISLPHDTTLQTPIVSIGVLSDFLFCFICNGWQNRASCLHHVLQKLSKSATKTFEMLHEAFGEHSLNRTAVFHWYSRFKAV
jgi:hypothetical protein